MHAKAVAVASLGFLLLSNGSCITDVCKMSSGQVELKVTFTGFDLDAAATLEVDSSIAGPNNYFDRRIGTLAFPQSARSGSETFVLDPGAYIYSLREADLRFDLTVIMRVYDDDGRLLGEGRFERIGSRTNGCYLAQSMTVNGEQHCRDHDEGDPCVSTTDELHVCMGAVPTCEPSTCGDGFVDRRSGELCDGGPPLSEGNCHTDRCLPGPIEVSLHSGRPAWQRLDAPGPPPREGAAVATIDASGTPLVVLFGGQSPDGSFLNDTWIFDGTQWTEYPTGGPSPRAEHAMAFDANTGQLVLVGGRNLAVINDAWTFTHQSGWAAASLGGGLTGRFGHAMAYDGDRGVVVLHGGATELGNLPPSDSHAWRLEATGWEPDGDTGVQRSGHTLTYVPALGGLLLLGGQTSRSSGAIAADRYVFNGNSMNPTDTAGMTVPQRVRHQAVFSIALGELVVFGGITDGFPNYDGDIIAAPQRCAPQSTDLACTDMSSRTQPHGRWGHVMFELNGNVYVHGGRAQVRNGEGDDPPALLSDTWQLALPVEEMPSLVHPITLLGWNDDQTLVQGLHDLQTCDATTAPMERASALLVADLDGDSQDELAIGLPGATSGQVILRNFPLLASHFGNSSLDMLTIVGPEDAARRGSYLGNALAAGDVNRDGSKDLVLGAPRARGGGGALYLFPGGEGDDRAIPPSASGDILQVEGTAEVDRYRAFNPPGAEAGARPYHLGYSVAVGDFNGDGIADVVASAPSDGTDPDGLSSVYILQWTEGDPPPDGPGWPAGRNPEPISDWSALRITTSTPELQLGYALTTGDLDGDGFSDLIIGTAPRSPTSAPPGFGAVAVIFGGQGFFERAEPTLIVEQLDPADGVLLAAEDDNDPLARIGGTLVAVDLDDDGLDDLAATLGRPDRTTGEPSAVALLPGTAFRNYRSNPVDTQSIRTEATVLLGPPGSGFGAALSKGDTNGDRRFDLIIGAPYQPSMVDVGFLPEPEAGAIYVVLGSRRASYFSAGETPLELLLATDVDSLDYVPIPLIAVRGRAPHGFLGSATATSSHLPTVDLAPAGYTLLLEPGWFDYAEPDVRNKGRLWTLYLAGLLGCESSSPCPTPY